MVRWLALGARGVLNPMASFLGGVVGQEVLKVRCVVFARLDVFVLVYVRVRTW